MPYGTPIFVEGEEIICFDPAKELLKFEHPFTLNKEFRVVDFRGQLAEILRGNTDAATLSWEEIDITFANIFDQFRQQSVEFKTSIDLGPNNKLLFQTIPSRGTEDHVENFLIGSKGGVKVMPTFTLESHHLSRIIPDSFSHMVSNIQGIFWG